MITLRFSLRPSLFLLPVIALQTAALAPRAVAETLKERQAMVYETVRKVGPAVVAIQGTGRSAMGTGSGVIVSKDGLILTAGHVLAATGDELSIVLPGGREVKAKALGRDMNRDAAMAQITEPGEYPFVEMGTNDVITKGQWCLALGHPGGFDPQRGAPLRVGRLWETDADTYFRSDCTVSGGDSGGPLFDLQGRLIGIHSSISLNLNENRHVPIGIFKKDWDKLKEGKRWGNLNRLMPGLGGPGGEEEDSPPEPDSDAPPRGQSERRTPAEPAPMKRSQKAKAWLGLSIDPLPGQKGVVVVEVSDESPAAKAGLQLEDVITAVDGKAITDGVAFVDRVAAAAPGDKLKLTIERDGKEVVIDVTLAPVP